MNIKHYTDHSGILRAARTFLCVLLCAALLTSCAGTMASDKDDLRVVMTVNGTDVPYEMYRYVVMNLKDGGVSSEDELREQSVSTLKSFYAVFSLADDYGIDPDNDYISSLVDSAIENQIDELGGRKEYKKMLSDNHMNDSVFRLLTKQDMMRDEIMKEMIAVGDISKDEDKLRAIIESDEFICIKQILITDEETSSLADGTYIVNGTTHTYDEAKALAETAHDRAAAGEDFDSLVAEYGQSLYMFGNTDGYYLCRGMWDEVNEEAAFALDMSEVSNVVQSDIGFSIFKRCEKREAFIDAHFEEICDNWYSACYMNALQKRIAFSEAVTNETFDSISASDMK